MHFLVQKMTGLRPFHNKMTGQTLQNIWTIPFHRESSYGQEFLEAQSPISLYVEEQPLILIRYLP